MQLKSLFLSILCLLFSIWTIHVLKEEFFILLVLCRILYYIVLLFRNFCRLQGAGEDFEYHDRSNSFWTFEMLAFQNQIQIRTKVYLERPRSSFRWIFVKFIKNLVLLSSFCEVCLLIMKIETDSVKFNFSFLTEKSAALTQYTLM